MSVTTSWLIIGIAAVGMIAFYGMVDLIVDLFEHWKAARKGEAQQTNKEKGSFSLWQS